MKQEADIAVVGLGVMGENLILNIESKGFTVACHNRTIGKVDDFLNGRGKGKNIIGCHEVEELATCLKKPGIIMLMVKAGLPVDDFINALLPHLKEGAVIIDGGNSHYHDSMRRTKMLAEKDIFFVGAGISGGEEGALNGPSIMPGGDPRAWPSVKPIFEAIAAKADDGVPCCAWIGNDGAGHFVKMVHNGIEYGDMQLICEAYQLMSQGLGMTPAEMRDVFANWNKGVLNSYLIGITSGILAKIDPETNKPVVDIILDTAGQKGTGKWTSIAGLDLGIPVPQITEAVFARCISAIKDERVVASGELNGPDAEFHGEKSAFIGQLHDAIYAAKICSYAQGFHLFRAASAEFGWNLKFGEIASIWRNGCIIRAQFLGKIKEAFEAKPDLANLILDPYFSDVILGTQDAWRNVVKTAVDLGLPVPAMSAALNYYDSYRCARLPANLLQAQRDYIGAHTYERVDKPRGEFFHTDWSV